ncbi:hypothetical protein, partial [Staphylococcus pseudintermedius]|uniref:hypothetical protein n=1 Tax=Staphylococcus pseudintermedius TaxID=283734 RepID=UPI0010D0D125
YKVWSLVTFCYFIFSVLVAYEAGDGGNAILSFDGKDITLLSTGLYLCVSVGYFIVQFFKNKKV